MTGSPRSTATSSQAGVSSSFDPEDYQHLKGQVDEMERREEAREHEMQQMWEIVQQMSNIHMPMTQLLRIINNIYFLSYLSVFIIFVLPQPLVGLVNMHIGLEIPNHLRLDRRPICMLVDGLLGLIAMINQRILYQTNINLMWA